MWLLMKYLIDIPLQKREDGTRKHPLSVLYSADSIRISTDIKKLIEIAAPTISPIESS